MQNTRNSISPELNELEVLRIEQRAKMKGISSETEYLFYKHSPEYMRQRLLDPVRVAEEAEANRERMEIQQEKENFKARVRSWIALGLSSVAAAASVLSYLTR